MILRTPPSVDLLPSHLKLSTSIISLTHDGNKEIKDNLCMFRCLALHFGGKRQGLERSAKSDKRQLEQATGLYFDKGVCISHIPDIDRIFDVAINVYDLQPDGMADVIYLSKFKYPSLHLNVFKNHCEI